MDQGFQTQIIPKDPDIRTPELRSEMISVLSHSYLNPELVIDRRFLSSDKIFTLRKGGVLHGFSSYTFFNLTVGNDIIPTIYLGIMAASSNIQNKGFIFKVMDHMVRDMKRESETRETDFLIWATTATLSSVSIFNHYFKRVSPDAAYQIREEHIAIANSMKDYLSEGRPDLSEHPLIVKELLPLSAYSPLETRRNQQIQRKKSDNIIDSLGITEVKGDRLLLIGHLF